MNLLGRLKLTAEIARGRLFILFLMLAMCFISFYMADICMSDYFYNLSTIKRYEGSFGEDNKNIYWINSQVSNKDMEQPSYEFFSRFGEIEGVEAYGAFLSNNCNLTYDGSGEAVYDGLIKVIAATPGTMSIAGLKLSDEQIDEFTGYEGEYTPVYVGSKFADRLAVGTVFSVSGFYEEQQCIVCGVLPEGAKWLWRGRYTSIQDTGMDEAILLCADYDEYIEMNKYATGKIQVYFKCEESQKQEVQKDVYELAAECGYYISIYNIGEEIEDLKSEYGLSDNKQFYSSVMLIVIAVLSIMIAVMTMCMQNKKTYGIMRAFGVPQSSISFVIVIQNAFVNVVGAAAAWLVRRGRIYEMYGDSFERGEDVITSAWNYSHNIVMPVILAACVVFTITAASVFPVMYLKRLKPIEMIKS